MDVACIFLVALQRSCLTVISLMPRSSTLLVEAAPCHFAQGFAFARRQLCVAVSRPRFSAKYLCRSQRYRGAKLSERSMQRICNTKHQAADFNKRKKVFLNCGSGDHLVTANAIPPSACGRLLIALRSPTGSFWRKAAVPEVLSISSCARNLTR